MIKTFQKIMGTLFFGAEAVIKPENLQSSRLWGIPLFFSSKIHATNLQLCSCDDGWHKYWLKILDPKFVVLWTSEKNDNFELWSLMIVVSICCVIDFKITIVLGWIMNWSNYQVATYKVIAYMGEYASFQWFHICLDLFLSSFPCFASKLCRVSSEF